MKKNTCPFLGLQEDPTTALNFPSEGNYCHKAQPNAVINRVHQQNFCLTERHIQCPVYKTAKPVPLPFNLASHTLSNAHNRRILAIASIPVLLAFIAVAVMAWNVFGASLGLFNKPIPQTGADHSQPSAWKLFTDTATPFTPITPTPLSEPQAVSCPLPQGWIPYQVNPTDLLFRLSVVYQVSVEELQRVNCLGNQSVILPGQTIYLPPLPTDEPTLIATSPIITGYNGIISVARNPLAVPQSNFPSQGGSKQSAPPSPSSTPIPPTSTPVPPTSTPVPPTSKPKPPTQQPPTAQPTDIPPAARPTNPPQHKPTNPPKAQPQKKANNKPANPPAPKPKQKATKPAAKPKPAAPPKVKKAKGNNTNGNAKGKAKNNGNGNAKGKGKGK